MMVAAPDPSQNARSAKAERLVLAGEARSEAMQRLQIGLVGLAAMLLMVALANIVTERAKQSDAGTVAASVDASADEAAGPLKDPLVDAGVVPNLPTDKADQAATPSAGAKGNGRAD